MEKIEIKIKENGEIYIEGEAKEDFNCKILTEEILKKIFEAKENILIKPKRRKNLNGTIHFIKEKGNNNK